MTSAPRFGRWAAVVVAAAAGGCSPTFDWREVRPEGAGVVALFPCKAQADRRTASIDSHTVTLSLHACRAATMTFGLAHVDVEDARRVAPALEAMRTSWLSTPGAQVVETATMQAPASASPSAAAPVRLRIMRPGQPPADSAAAFFAIGTRVFQVTAYGAPLDGEAAQTFLSSVRDIGQPR